MVTGRDQAGATAIANELPHAIGFGCDPEDAGARQRLLGATRQAFGEPEISVLNGPGPTPGSASDPTVEEAEGGFRSLLQPHLGLISAVLGRMRRRAWGRILALGPSGVQQPLPMLAASNLGRAAPCSHLKTLASEVAADGVTVNMLLPGRIATDRVARLYQAAARRAGVTEEQARAASIARTPVHRYGRPDEFGAAAAFLCSDAVAYITASQVRCDGGLIAHP